MAGQESIFKKMDAAIFAKIDQLKQGPAYSQFVQTLGTLSEGQRRHLNLTVSIIFLFVPLALFSYLALKGISMRKQLNMKKEILEISSTILNNTAELEQAGRSFFSALPLSDKEALSSRVQAVAQERGIGLELLKIESFDSKVDKFGLTQTRSKLSFKDLTISQLSAFLGGLAQKDKVRLGDMEITKSGQNNMLSGTVELLHSGRSGP